MEQMKDDELLKEVQRRGHSNFDTFIVANWNLIAAHKKRILKLVGFQEDGTKIEGGGNTQDKK